MREYLGIVPGSGVEFDIDAGGAVVMRNVSRSAKRAQTGSRFAAPRGTRRIGMSADEIMKLLREYSEDANDPGFWKSQK